MKRRAFCRSRYTECMDIRANHVSHRELYRTLLIAVGPRPIAWVSTLSKNGVPNLAPFSFFNVVSANPPMLGFSPGIRRLPNGSEPKGTLVNIRETGEFVVNVVTFELAELMNITSGEYEHGVNEFDMAGLASRTSQIVRPPQVAGSPVSFECKLDRILDFGNPVSNSLVIGEIVALHIEDRVLHEGRLELNSLDLIGRMGGAQYARTTNRFEMERPVVKR
jgi:flavin reductase (DIM6/NTAB) family NADH-FMN oxidoreductase RutF